MPIRRRAALALPFLGLLPAGFARAQPPAAPPPVLFLHGNGDHAALWQTTLWRFESNGWPREYLRAVNLPDPLARDDDAVPQPMRSGSVEQTERLAEFVRIFRAETGAARIALAGNSRGGNPIRDFTVQQGGASQVSHAILCGTPNRGVMDWPERAGNEFNSRGRFLSRLNAGPEDVVEGTAFLTLRSDSNDLYAQPRAIWSPTPDRPTGTDVDGPELRGATNLVLPGLDHREVAYHGRAFAEMARFVAGRAPARIAVLPEARPTLDGLVTGTPGGVQTNRPVEGALVEVFRTDPETGARMGEAIHRRTTAADGRWGPVTVEAGWTLEVVVAAPGHPITHIYRSPFPRSSAVMHLRPARPLTEADRAAGGVLLLTRPRGYLALPRDAILLDGAVPADIPRGIARAATATLRLPAGELGRPIPALFNDERIVARAWPAAEGRIAVAELTW
ncbi:hydrolase [Belnapia sp. T18]|uniref:Hydrolase n=1 Tax=Belnapia arida TaxID=2804533 RepID=A0ABS1U4T8_9PROT|nr:hydrolase [Belnapia arida]MBL6079714.1 hydrolase [Belnapia arida]